MSSFKSFTDVFRMPFTAETRFEKAQLDQYAVIQQEAQRTLLANLMGIGALGQTQGSMNAYGSSWQFWDSIAYGVANFGWIMVLIGLVLALASGFARLGNGAMWAGVFTGMFFFTYLVAYYSTTGKMWMVTYKPALVSFLIALTAATAITFGLYAPAAKRLTQQVPEATA